jgi:radical SAM superfamily enzyme YgiQ (UPF0313 family)
VSRSVVLEDIRSQVEDGAAHITFGDPDFFNGPAHAMHIVETLHAEFPKLSYDVTIKVEHLRKHRDLLPRLKESGCLFVTSAVESFDDKVLEKLDKGHTQADFIAVLDYFRSLDLALAPTFVAFTPWTTVETYHEMLRLIIELDLVDQISPVQLALRLLIPAGSRVLELPEMEPLLIGFDEAALLHRWRHPAPQVDALATEV